MIFLRLKDLRLIKILRLPTRIYLLNLFKLISELTAKGSKDNHKAKFQNNQSAQKNKNQRFLKTIVNFFIDNDQL